METKVERLRSNFHGGCHIAVGEGMRKTAPQQAPRLGRAGHGSVRQGTAGQGKARQISAAQGNAKQSRAGQGRAGLGRAG